MRQTEPEGSPPVERCLACEADGEQGEIVDASPPCICALCRDFTAPREDSSRVSSQMSTFHILDQQIGERRAARSHLLTIGLASEAALHGWLPLRRVAVSPIRRFASICGLSSLRSLRSNLLRLFRISGRALYLPRLQITRKLAIC